MFFTLLPYSFLMLKQEKSFCGGIYLFCKFWFNGISYCIVFDKGQFDIRKSPIQANELPV